MLWLGSPLTHCESDMVSCWRWRLRLWAEAGMCGGGGSDGEGGFGWKTNTLTLTPSVSTSPWKRFADAFDCLANAWQFVYSPHHLSRSATNCVQPALLIGGMSGTFIAFNSLCIGHFSQSGSLMAGHQHACHVHSSVMGQHADNLCVQIVLT